ncbi:MAG: hypothetical protein AAGI08_07530 [Bacteroidota bacterium]
MIAVIKQKYPYTYEGLLAALVSLFPIFSAWTLFPIFGIHSQLEKSVGSCTDAMDWLWQALVLIASALAVAYYIFVFRTQRRHPYRRWIFLGFCSAEFVLVNGVLLISMTGIEALCYSQDGQLLLGVIFTGPLSSASLLGFGITSDGLSWLREKTIRQTPHST